MKVWRPRSARVSGARAHGGARPALFTTSAIGVSEPTTQLALIPYPIASAIFPSLTGTTIASLCSPCDQQAIHITAGASTTIVGMGTLCHPENGLPSRAAEPQPTEERRVTRPVNA